GASTYKIPAGIDPDDYNEVWIWCEKFNVPLGVAKL
ncbi:DM13 domain-containing protein, partial [Litoreibacter halocynthiae]